MTTPLPEPVEPTEENIARLRINLKNIQHFNDQLYTYTITKTANCFLLFTRTDNNDPGMNIGDNLLCGSMIGVGTECGIIGAIVANYYCGLIGSYSINPPPTLLVSYTSYITRIQSTSIQADMDMANSDSDPVSKWNTVTTGSYSTPWGIKTASCTLGQLAAVDIPDETNIEYDQMMVKAVFAFDQMLWWSMMNQNYQVNGWNTGLMLPLTIQASDVPNGDTGMNNYCNNYMVNTPPHWTYWLYYHSADKKGRDTSTYTMYDYSIGNDPTSRGSDQPIPNTAAQYLFIDTIPGTVINANGLFNRFFVFNDFGLKKIEQV
jgi:hypothetical protein